MTVRLFAAVLAVCCAPLVIRAADDDNPFKNSKVGDYATYKLTMKVLGQTIPGTATQSVTAKTDKEATVKTTSSFDFNGMKRDIPEQEQTIDLTKPFDPTKVAAGGLPAGADLKIEKGKEGKEKIKTAGKEYECTWTTYTIKGKFGDQEISADAKTWMSKDLALGMVKMEMTLNAAGQKIDMTMELTENGNKKK